MKDKKEEPDGIGGWLNKDVANYLGLGVQLAASVVIMVFVGIWLDEKFNTEPVLTIVCSLLGIFAGMYNFLKTVLKSDK